MSFLIDRKTSPFLLISLFLHLLPLIIFSIVSLPHIMKVVVKETVLTEREPIVVEIVESKPEVRKPMFGKDSITDSTAPSEKKPVARKQSPAKQYPTEKSTTPPKSVESRLVRAEPDEPTSSPEPEISIYEKILKVLESAEDNAPIETSEQNTETSDETNQEETEEKPDIDTQMAQNLQKIAAWMGETHPAESVDVAFILDTSGSMEDNIVAVGNHLNDMISSLKSSGIDARVAVVKYRYLERDMLVFPFTSDIERYRRLLKNVRSYGDEMTYDALWKAMDQLEFRPNARRHFVLVTDEPMKGNISFIKVLDRCREMGIAVTVIGLNDPLHRALARQTGGILLDIPK